MHITHIISCLGEGGAQAMLHRLCAGAREHRHSVISLSGLGKYGPLLAESGAKVFSVGAKGIQDSPNTVAKISEYLNALHPDVVQTWMYHADLLGGVVARGMGVKPVVWCIRNGTLSHRYSKAGTILAARVCALLSHVIPNRIIVCAQSAAEVHSRIGYSKRRMRIIPNGYDCQYYERKQIGRSEFLSSLGLAEDLPLIGTVGRFDKQKDHANLIKALSLLQKKAVKFGCLLVGTNIQESNKALLKLLAESEVSHSVRLLGSREDIPFIMSCLDLHILSSSFGEAFPNVVAEAMACGTPCVSTDVGDASLVIGDTGWVVPTQNPVLLSAAIEAAVSQIRKPQWDARCAAARQRICKEFSIEKTVKAYNDVWCEAASQQS